MQKIAKSRRKRQKRNDEIDIKRKIAPITRLNNKYKISRLRSKWQNEYKTQNCVAKTKYYTYKTQNNLKLCKNSQK